MSALEENVEKFYDFIYPLVLKAGVILLDGYNKPKNIETKGSYYDMVTEYDIKIENFLINEIKKTYPDHKFIGEEETAFKNFTSELTDLPTWIIDPIDGTSNFIKGIPHTCISVGLAIGKEVVIGIINNPVLSELYTARKGQGAFLNGQPVQVSKCQTLQDAHIAYEISLIHEPTIRQKHIKRAYNLGSKATRTLSFASVAISLCYVAKGAIDAYHIEDMYPWDVAAGSLLVKEAGGSVFHSKGGQFDVMQVSLVCAGTQNLAKEIIEVIEKAGQFADLE